MIKIITIEAIIMGNGEVISGGKSLGYERDFEPEHIKVIKEIEA